MQFEKRIALKFNPVRSNILNQNIKPWGEKGVKGSCWYEQVGGRKVNQDQREM